MAEQCLVDAAVVRLNPIIEGEGGCVVRRGKGIEAGVSEASDLCGCLTFTSIDFNCSLPVSLKHTDSPVRYVRCQDYTLTAL